MSSTLVAGVLLAALACLAIGLSLDWASTAPAAATPLALGDLPAALIHGEAVAWLSLGVVGLLLTPLVRVGSLLGTFWREGEVAPLISALLVLVLLLVALALGFFGIGLRGNG